MRRVRKRERECGEPLFRSQPHETASAQVDIGQESRRVPRADAAVEPVGGDHHVGVERPGGGNVVLHVVLEGQLDAERLASRLQDVEQALAPDAAEPVAAALDRASLEMDVDVIPVIERSGDLVRRFRIGRGQVAQRLVGKHDAPPERVIGPIALRHPVHVARIGLLQQQSQVEAGGTAADAEHAHDRE